MFRRISRSIACAVALTCTASLSSAHFADGQIWIVDQVKNRLYFVNPTNFNINVSAFGAAQGLAGPSALGFSLHGDMIIGNFNSNEIFNIEGDLSHQVVLTSADGIDKPFGGNAIAIGPGHGDVFITNFGSTEILKVDENYLNPVVFADAGDGLVEPGAMSFLANGDMLIADRGTTQGMIFSATEAGVVTPFFAMPNGETPISITISKSRDIFILTGRGSIYRLIGGDPLNAVVLGVYGSPALRGSINMSVDQTTLYHVNQSDSFLRAIDIATGTSTIAATIPFGGTGTAMVAVGTHVPPGSFVEFGDGLAGTGGIVPLLEGHLEPRIGQPFDLEVSGAIGQSRVFTIIGSMEESILFGGEFHIDLAAPNVFFANVASGAPGVAGAGTVLYNLGIGNDPTLVYVSVFAQSVVLDAGAIQGASLSNCLEIYIGE